MLRRRHGVDCSAYACATAGAGHREGSSGAFSASVRSRAGVRHHLRPAPTAIVVTTAATAAVLAAPTATAVAVPAAVLAVPTAAVVTTATVTVPAAVVAAVITTDVDNAGVATAATVNAAVSVGIWSDSIEDSTVPSHAAGVVPTAAFVTTDAVAISAAVVAAPIAVVAAPIAAAVTIGTACAGVRTDQVQDGPAREAAPLDGTPGLSPPSWTYIDGWQEALLSVLNTRKVVDGRYHEELPAPDVGGC